MIAVEILKRYLEKTVRCWKQELSRRGTPLAPLCALISLQEIFLSVVFSNIISDLSKPRSVCICNCLSRPATCPKSWGYISATPQRTLGIHVIRWTSWVHTVLSLFFLLNRTKGTHTSVKVCQFLYVVSSPLQIVIACPGLWSLLASSRRHLVFLGVWKCSSIFLELFYLNPCE